MVLVSLDHFGRQTSGGLMRRKLFAILCSLVCLGIFSCGADAQVDEHAAEVGAVFTNITLTDFQNRAFPGIGSGNSVVSGLGGRFSYNFNDKVALDTEGSFFPEAHLGNEEFGQKLQAFAGVKVGIRKKHIGVFAKLRPGVMWFGEFSSRGSCSTTSFGSVCGVDHEKDFALDAGGVFEFYPTDRLLIRADLGDTIIRYPSHTFGTFGSPLGVPGETKNNLQVSIGIGWRF